MKGIAVGILFCIFSKNVLCIDYEFEDYLNRTDPVDQQIYTYKKFHPHAQLLTTSAGEPTDLRDTMLINSDVFANQFYVDLVSNTNVERVPERLVHAKGAAAFGYFEVTHDISKYTKADVFNGIGKKTTVLGRFSTALQNNDLVREMKAIALKFYTKEGNLDFLCIHFPVYFYREPISFPFFVRSFKRNPKTNLFDFTMRWDFMTSRPDALHAILWLLSDYGIPNGYRKMDAFPIHGYEVHNKHGERFIVKFNFRTEQGLEGLSTEAAQEIGGRDGDYFNRDLYDAIANKNYPAWKLELDVIKFEDLKKLDYNPFEVNRMWKKGTYITVPVGRLVFDRNADNAFRVSELSAFNPGNLVPGIPGPPDNMFKTRRSVYRDTQLYRLGINHNKLDVNEPLYERTYNRDGVPPVRDNMDGAPNYYPNSFHGPMPYVDVNRPKERLALLETNAVDLEPCSHFYNHVLTSDSQRERLANFTIPTLTPVAPYMQRRVLRLFSLIDPDLGRRVARRLREALGTPPRPEPEAITIDRQGSSDPMPESESESEPEQKSPQFDAAPKLSRKSNRNDNIYRGK